MDNLKQMVKNHMNARAVKLPYDIRNHTPRAFYDELAEAAILAVADWLDAKASKYFEDAETYRGWPQYTELIEKGLHHEEAAKTLREELEGE